MTVSFPKIQDFIIQEVVQQKNRLFVWSPFFLAIGIAIYFALPFEPTLILGVLGFVTVSVLFFIAFSFSYQETVQSKINILISLLFMLVTMGFLAGQIRTTLVYTPMLSKAIGPVNLEGMVERVEPQEAGQGSRIIVSDLSIERLEQKETPRKIRLKVRKDQGIISGQRIRVLVKLNPPSSPVAPGAFDFQRYAFFKGFGAVGFAYNQPEILEQAKGFNFFWSKARESLAKRIRESLGGRSGAIATALMTGQRGAIAKEDVQAMRDSGLAHLLAISGLHVGMIVGFLFFFARFAMASVPSLALHQPIKKYAAIIALIGGFFYTLIVGATIPTQRALMMSGLVLVAVMLDREALSLRLVAMAAVIILLITPESLVSVSFQMSFAAVVALVCFYDQIRPIWRQLHSRAGIIRRIALYFSGVILTTVIAGFATGFFALYHFQTFALYGTLANIVAVPIMAFLVMPLLLVSYLVMPLGLEAFVLPIAGWGISWILGTAHWVGSMEGSVSRIVSFPQILFISTVICLWVFCVWKGSKRRVAALIALILMVIATQANAPDIQISPSFKLVSMKDNEGRLILSSGRQDRYTAENWLRRNGQVFNEKSFFPKEGEAKSTPLRCDTKGCRLVIKNTNVTYAKTKQAAYEDCEWADLILSEEPFDQRECNQAKVVDFFDLYYQGSHSIFVKKEAFTIKMDRQTRGQRPWVNIAN
ncbi:MAG: ComEC/Rec2 family competence protein [Pseudomonadota bacterium]